jgi:protease IV
MSDTPQSTPPPPEPPRPAAAIPQSAPPPHQPSAQQQAWYSGPYPVPGAREGAWSMIWRTATKATIAGGCFGMSLITFLLLPGIILVAAIAACAGDGGGDDYDFVFGTEGAPNRLLSIPIQGVILGEEPDETSIFGSPGIVYGYEIKKKLAEAALDRSIDGIILEFETPGGTIFGSQAIADGVREYQQATGKPVLAFVAGISASGGMYGMAPADLILADHGSLLGSIGVTMGAFEYWDLLIGTEGGIFGGGVTTANGIEFQPITAGRGKDVGAPYRRLTEEERQVLQQAVDDIYDDFVALVSETRGIPEATIRNQIGAMVYANKQAQELGLIDGTANRQQAYERAAQLASLSAGTWQVVRESSDLSLFGGLFGRSEAKPAESSGPSGICFPAHTVLAYYGDPLLLCAGR